VENVNVESHLEEQDEDDEDFEDSVIREGLNKSK